MSLGPLTTRGVPALSLRVCALLALVALAGCDATPPAGEGGVATTPAAPVPLVEVTTAVGLPDPGAAPWPDGSWFLPEIMGPGVGLLDYDGDGDLDILQRRVPPPGRRSEPAPDRLWASDGQGAYREVGAAAGLADSGFAQGLAVGDIDNDGDPDVYLANLDDDRLYLNDGGQFREITSDAGIAVPSWSAAATFCDYDGDGWLDLYVVGYLQVNYAGPCRNTGGVPDYCGPATFEGESDRLFRNRGDGTFEDVSASAGIADPGLRRRAKGLGVVCLDLTDDGRPDFYVANDGEANQLWVQGARGSFVDQGLARGVAVNRHGRAEASMGIAVGDLAGDGRADLYLTHLALENNTLYVAGNGPFSDRTVESRLAQHDLPWTGFGCGFFDLEHDGDLDLAVVNGAVRGVIPDRARADAFWSRYAEPNLLLVNDGEGRFEARTSADFTDRREVGRGLALGDLDGDGDQDLVLSNVDGSVRVFDNRAPTADRHWLRLRLRAGARPALGARVRLVDADGRRQTRWVLRGYGYQSSHEPTVHFGLGRSVGPVTVEVDWPDGRQQHFELDRVDRTWELVQGEAAPW